MTSLIVELSEPPISSPPPLSSLFFSLETFAKESIKLPQQIVITLAPFSLLIEPFFQGDSPTKVHNITTEISEKVMEHHRQMNQAITKILGAGAILDRSASRRFGGICNCWLKATCHSTIFDIPMRLVRQDQRYGGRFTR